MSDAQPSLSLEEILDAELENPSPPASVAPRSTGAAQRACEQLWQEKLKALREEMRVEADWVTKTKKAAEPLVSKVRDAKQVVIDPNSDALSKHLDNMQKEHLEAAISDSTSNIRSVMKAKALHIHRVIMAAMDDVEKQFEGGMEQVVKPLLADVLTEAQTADLCNAVVHSHRLALNQTYTLPCIEQLIEAQVDKLPDFRRMAASAANSEQPLPSTDPLSWLYGIVMGSVRFDLGEEINCWLATTTANYLDPFLDDEVFESQYQTRSAGYFIDRVKSAWAAEKPKSGTSVSQLLPEYCLAQYMRHTITKMNANQGFGPHIPGIGRQPCSAVDQGRHVKRLGAAVIQAIERDFLPEHRCIGTVTVTPNLVAELSTAHLGACIAYEQELGNALAVANREGEEARRFERLRIWGYC